MGMFSVREPRRFEHKYIYYDERKDKLKKIEESAKRDLGMLPQESFNPENIRGKFVEGTKHLKKRKENGGPRLTAPTAVFIIVLLLVLLHSILSGAL